LLVITMGAEATCTLAVSRPAVAVNVIVAVPVGGVRVVDRPDVPDSAPAVVVQVIASVLCTRTAVNVVGPEICAAPDELGVIVSAGSPSELLLPPQAESGTARSQAAAMKDKRIRYNLQG